jgi:hypothetical protein
MISGCQVQTRKHPIQESHCLPAWRAGRATLLKNDNFESSNGNVLVLDKGSGLACTSCMQGNFLSRLRYDSVVIAFSAAATISSD